MVDRYTKAVLTIIAAALVAIAAQNAMGPLNAQQGVQRVAICDTMGSACVAPWKYAEGTYGLTVHQY